MAPKRPRATPSGSGSQQQANTTTTTTTSATAVTSSQQPRPTKRTRVDTHDNKVQDQHDHDNEPLAQHELDPNSTLPAKPIKRTLHKGKLRRLATTTIIHNNTSTRAIATTPNQTLNGHKIGGKAKDLKPSIWQPHQHLWVTRRKGMGFAGYLKRACRAIIDRGVTTLTLTAMGAAIPLALSLALAIKDNLSPSNHLDNNNKNETIQMQIKTNSCNVQDEITPQDQDQDLIYQTRTKSTIEINLIVSLNLSRQLNGGIHYKQRLHKSDSSSSRGQNVNLRGRKRHGVGRSSS
ncbi:hypothetical protein OIO90_001665 [Microbotryomycetes sp. JL221]|nr:hypothetical protein OIO90_001665 [Microbotryomycetes sp. JL221]